MNNKTVKNAILKSLEELKIASTPTDIYEYIIKKSYYDFKNAKTPISTIQAQAGAFIRQNDIRVKSVKNDKNNYIYYLSKYEDELDFNSIKYSNIKTKSINNNKNDYKYHERDLHKLLSTFLQNQNQTIYSKTVLHEKSYNSKDNTQKWIHPDMIGVEFLSLKSKTTQSLIKLSNNSKTFKLISYEIKREIQTDSELKKSYFQAVSNSSWANYGYLVLLDINSNLIDELQRLNESFGIGVIKLTKDIYDSKILFEARYKELDFKTIDKLCNINTEYNDFISLIEKYLNANEKYKEISLNELKEFSDDYFKSEDEIITYCKKNNIRDDD